MNATSRHGITRH